VKRPKVATLFCAEGLRAPACVVLDALSVRGWSVSLRTGDAAREALKQFRDPNVGLRVLCLPEPLDRASTQALRKALDPMQRGDLLIVDFFTPRSVVENILRFSGYRVGARRHARPRRTTRSYLAQPTMVERTVDVGYWSRYGLGAAAAGVAFVGGMSAFWALDTQVDTSPSLPETVAEAPVEAPVRSRLVDETIHAASVPTTIDVEPIERPTPVVRPVAALPPEEEPEAALEEIVLPTPPTRNVAAVERRRIPAAAIAHGGAPGLPRR
jgi:hypothetical protein